MHTQALRSPTHPPMSQRGYTHELGNAKEKEDQPPANQAFHPFRQALTSAAAARAGEPPFSLTRVNPYIACSKHMSQANMHAFSALCCERER